MPPKGLLFINKSPHSASLSNNRSDSDSRKRINQHVQSTRDLEKERALRKRRRKAILRAFGQASEAASSENSPTTTSTEPPVGDNNAGLLTPPKTPGRLSETGVEELNKDAGSVDSERLVSLAPLDYVNPERAATEPFNIIKVRLDNEKYRVLQYFILQFFPAVSRSDTGGFFEGPVPSTYGPAVQVVKDCLSLRMHTFALLGASSARMKYAGAPLTRLDMPETYAEITMQLLRDYLTDNLPVDEKLLQTIFFLQAVESYRRNWSGVKTHQLMIKNLYETHLGGFRNLSYHLRKMIWFGDRFQASATAEPPLIEESWDAHEISWGDFATILDAIAMRGHSQTGTAFRRCGISFSTGFEKHIDEVVELATILQCYWTPLDVPCPDRDWVIGKSFTSSDHLLFFKDDRPKGVSPLDVLIQDCIRLAMIVWLAFIPSPMTGVAPASKTMEVKLRAAIDARPLRSRFATLLARYPIFPLEDDYDSKKARLFLWISGLGAAASELVENQEWFSARFRSFSRSLHVYSWKEFQLIEHDFLRLDRLDNSTGQRLKKIFEVKSGESTA